MKFYENLTDGKKSALIGGIIAVILFSIIFYFANERNEKLKNNSFKTYGIIEKLSPRQHKGTTTQKDIIYFYFIKNGTVYHKKSDLNVNGIENRGIELNDCFEVKVVKNDYTIFEIDFDKKIDTIIEKDKFKKRIYNSRKHREIIE